MDKHIFPIHDQILKREDKEKLLQQRAKVIWMTGLSGSGKTTLAKALEKNLHDAGFMLTILDGDNVRDGINSNLGFSDEELKTNRIIGHLPTFRSYVGDGMRNRDSACAKKVEPNF